LKNIIKTEYAGKMLGTIHQSGMGNHRRNVWGKPRKNVLFGTW